MERLCLLLERHECFLPALLFRFIGRGGVNFRFSASGHRLVTLPTGTIANRWGNGMRSFQGIALWILGLYALIVMPLMLSIRYRRVLREQPQRKRAFWFSALSEIAFIGFVFVVDLTNFWDNLLVNDLLVVLGGSLCGMGLLLFALSALAGLRT